MKYFGSDKLSEQHKELSKIIVKADRHDAAMALFLDTHAQLHRGAVSGGAYNEVDTLFADLQPSDWSIMPTPKDETIAWTVWHIARIEDMTVNMLAAQGEQLFNEEWQTRMSTSVTDTGNAMRDDEIIRFSESVKHSELLLYRDAVGKQTRAVVSNLTTADMKRPVNPADIERIRRAGGVTEHPDSRWLLDYWGGKTVAGLLLMPPTRHLILHLNDCAKWKQTIQKNRS
ncbi:MAG: DinB family protein [Clostridiales bacterium]|nr:DinB family protein [Clostridiales bacterium]